MNQVAKKRFFEDVAIIDIAEEGKGVGKADDFVLFVDKAVPGDIADIEVYRSKKNFGEGKITTLKQPSEYRTKPFCEHFGTCGGCKWQHMTYESCPRLPISITVTNWSTHFRTSGGYTTVRTGKTSCSI